MLYGSNKSIFVSILLYIVEKMKESQCVLTQIIIYLVRYETGIKQFIDLYDTESNMSVVRIPIKYIGQIAVYRKWDNFTCIKIGLSKSSFDLDFFWLTYFYSIRRLKRVALMYLLDYQCQLRTLLQINFKGNEDNLI